MTMETVFVQMTCPICGRKEWVGVSACVAEIYKKMGKMVCAAWSCREEAGETEEDFDF